MDLFNLLNVLRRGWIAVAIGSTATILAVYVVGLASGVYQGQVNVVLLPPPNQQLNELNSVTPSLIFTAGVLAKLTRSATDLDPSVSGALTTLTGEGIYDGYSIQQINKGGQWQYSFDDPVLNVQSSGPTMERVQENMSYALVKIQTQLRLLQSKEGVRPEDMIRTSFSPSDPVYTFVHGSFLRASAGAAASDARRGG